MPRPATGTVVEKTTRRGRSFALRFRALGERQYLHLGYAEEGWNRQRAKRELRRVLDDVEDGVWRPPSPTPASEARPVPTFHVFASEWFAAGAWKPATRRAYHAELQHLLPYFAHMPVDRIDVAEVDGYRNKKVAEGAISGAYINKTLTRLGQILEVAVEQRLLDRNPLRVNSKNRRVKTTKPRRHYLDRAEQIAALLDAAGERDRRAERDLRSRQALSRRCLLAVLVFGGLRISEALALRWRDVDFPNGRLRVAGTKTEAAEREFTMLPALRDELLAHRASTRRGEPSDLLFSTNTGRPMDRTHTLSRILRPAVDAANVELEEAGLVPIPRGQGRGASLTQHGLRHTYASIRLALGHDLATVAREGGWEDLPTLLTVYTHVMGLEDGARDRLRALIEGRPLPALNGHQWALAPSAASEG